MEIACYHMDRRWKLKKEFFMERYEQCPVCGEDMVGDNYTSVYHCGSLDLIGEGFEADAGPIYCDDGRLPEYLKGIR